MYCTRVHGAPTQTTLLILTTVSTSNPVANIIKNSNVDGNVTLGKIKNRLTVFFYIVFFITFFFHHMSTLFYITSQETEQQPTCDTNTHFTIRPTYDDLNVLLQIHKEMELLIVK